MKRITLGLVLAALSFGGFAQTASTDSKPYQLMVDFKNATANSVWANAYQALNDKHWVTPAGNNAVEYYLAVHNLVQQQQTPDPVLLAATTDALQSLVPYVVLAAEAAQARNDASEVQRLSELLEQMDPAAPAVQRFKGAVPAPMPSSAL